MRAGSTVLCVLLMGVSGSVLAAPDDATQEASSGQRTYRFAPFSERYEATLEVAEAVNDRDVGTIRIRERDGGKLVIEQGVEGLVLDVEWDEADGDGQQLASGGQGLIVHEDFDFDGIKDFAVRFGNESCYGGPSYTVWLQREGGLQASEGLSALAQGYCGLFGVDERARRLETSTKSGCCWHEYTTWQVIDGEPVEERRVVDDQVSDGVGLPRETRWIQRDGRRVEQQRWLWDADNEGRHIVFAFTVQGNGKRVVVFQPYAGGELYYALVAGEHVELLYPSPDDANPRFEYWPITPPVNTDALAFERPGASYTVLGRHAQGGPAVYVRTSGKLFKLLAQPGAVEGDLDELAAVVARGGGSIKHLEVLMDLD